MISVYSPWWHPLKFSAQVTSFQETKNPSFHLLEGKPLHRSACLNQTQQSSPDLTPRECWLGTFRNCQAQKITIATNWGLGALAFQDGKCSAESWDFWVGEKKPKTAVQAKSPNQCACCKANAAENKMSAVKWYWACSADHQHQSLSHFRSLCFYKTESSQNAVLLSPSQALKRQFGSTHCLHRLGSAVQDMSPAPACSSWVAPS